MVKMRRWRWSRGGGVVYPLQMFGSALQRRATPRCRRCSRRKLQQQSGGWSVYVPSLRLLWVNPGFIQRSPEWEAQRSPWCQEPKHGCHDWREDFRHKEFCGSPDVDGQAGPRYDGDVRAVSERHSRGNEPLQEEGAVAVCRLLVDQDVCRERHRQLQPPKRRVSMTMRWSLMKHFISSQIVHRRLKASCCFICSMAPSRGQ